MPGTNGAVRVGGCGTPGAFDERAGGVEAGGAGADSGRDGAGGAGGAVAIGGRPAQPARKTASNSKRNECEGRGNRSRAGKPSVTSCTAVFEYLQRAYLLCSCG